MIIHHDGDRSDTDGNCTTLVSPSPVAEDMPVHPVLTHKSEAPTFDFTTLEYPDGGLRAWLQVFASMLICSLSWGVPGMFGVYQLHYTSELGLPQSQVAWIGSIQTFLAFFVCIISGRLCDAGYIRHSLITGTVFIVLGFMTTSVATTYWQILLAQGLCTGIGLGIIFMPAMTAVTSYFLKKRSLALALSAMGTGIGSLMYPAILQYSTPHIGFTWAVRVTGFVAFVCASTATILIRPRIPPRKSGPWVEWGALKEPPYMWFSAGVFCLFWAMYFNFFYITGYARNVIGMTSSESTNILMIAQAFTIPSRPISGFIADRLIGPLNTFIVMITYMAIMAYVWIGVSTKVGMYVFSVFFGIAMGASQGMFIGALASLTANPQKMGTRVGMVYAVLGIAGLTGTPVSGAIIDHMDGKYWGAQIWAATCFLTAAILVSISRYCKTGMKLHVKV